MRWRWSPTTVLFESQWTTAFPGRARGDRVLCGPSAEAATTAKYRILTLDLMRSEHTDDEVSNLSFCRQTARNGYVVEFSFFGSNFSPMILCLLRGSSPRVEAERTKARVHARAFSAANTKLGKSSNTQLFLSVR